MMEYKHTLLYKKITGLADVSEADLDKLFNLITVRQLKKGEIMLKPGQVCKNVYFVDTGYLRTFFNKGGIEINTAFTFENNFTSNPKSLRLGIPSDTAIEAGEKSVIYVFEGAALLRLYKESPEIESFGRKLLEQLLIEQEEHANIFKLFTPAERYKYLQENNPQMIQRVSLSQIASYLGVVRETISRIRKLK